MYILIIFGVIFFIISLFKKPNIEDKNEFSYEKKPFLFDNVSELKLYKILLELYGDKYHIFTQVNYSHLIQPKKNTWSEQRRERSRIDRKSADFVLCDREHVIPLLVIELDGSSHNLPSKMQRDAFIDDIMAAINFPILHIKSYNLDKELIKIQIDNKLNSLSQKYIN
jgi:very-short-patch-repair endonuclease